MGRKRKYPVDMPSWFYQKFHKSPEVMNAVNWFYIANNQGEKGSQQEDWIPGSCRELTVVASHFKKPHLVPVSVRADTTEPEKVNTGVWSSNEWRMKQEGRIQHLNDPHNYYLFDGVAPIRPRGSGVRVLSGLVEEMQRRLTHSVYRELLPILDHNRVEKALVQKINDTLEGTAGPLGWLTKTSWESQLALLEIILTLEQAYRRRMVFHSGRTKGEIVGIYYCKDIPLPDDKFRQQYMERNPKATPGDIKEAIEHKDKRCVYLVWHELD